MRTAAASKTSADFNGGGVVPPQSNDPNQSQGADAQWNENSR